MSREGYYFKMLQHGVNVLNDAAEDVAAFEEYAVYITFPGQPGVAPATIEVEGYFDTNPSPTAYAAVGQKVSLNGILYVRVTQAPQRLTNVYDQGVIAGLTFSVRGRKYRCVKAEFDRSEYLFMLSDMNEAPNDQLR